MKAPKPDHRIFPDDKDTSLGACLKRERFKRKWTQLDCAQHFKVGKDSYQKWEWNKITPVIQRRKKVCDFLGFNYWNNGTDSLANRLLIYRVEQKLTQEELALKIGVGTHIIERIEGKKNMVSIQIQCLISSFLNN